jgi:hypothetical protein
VASDGYHTVSDESEGAFEVPGSPPLVVIESPFNGSVSEPTDLIELRGRASLPDGSDDGVSYAWFLDGEFLESGTAADVTLEDGVHEIMLMAWDPEGYTGEATVEITVELNDPPNEPSQPFPADGAVNVPVIVVTDWVGGDIDIDPVTYDVYLEAGARGPSTLICDAVPLSQCQPPALLQTNTQYYWKVIASDEGGLTSEGRFGNLRRGPVERATSFTQTASSKEIAPAQVQSRFVIRHERYLHQSNGLRRK